MKLLLHTCCGPCFLGVWEDLKDSDLVVTNYFYNPNIQPKEEYDLRLDNLKKTLIGKDNDLLVADYKEIEHLNAISGLEDNFPERCTECYLLRLDKTAQVAKEKGYDYFSTTLLVSPYQKHEEIKAIGETVGKKYGVKFYYKDWRKYFRDGQKIAREKEIYRQKYCGCKFSLDNKN